MLAALHDTGLQGILFVKDGFNVTCATTRFFDKLGSGMRPDIKINLPSLLKRLPGKKDLFDV